MPKTRGRVTVLSLKNHAVIADQCCVADRFFARLRGLIGTTRLEPDEGMLLSPCNDVHMWFMSIPLDIVFLRRSGANYRVSSVHENARPWKALPIRDGAATETLELPAGTVRRHGIRAGDELCIS